MTLTVTHAKHNNIADWTQADLNAQIALGNFPAGTTLADIVLSSDWNHTHTVSGSADVGIGSTVTSGVDTRMLYIDPTERLAQSDMIRVISDGIEFGADPSFNNVVFGQDRTGGESGFGMRDDDQVLAAYSVGINQFSYGGGNAATPSLGFVNGNAYFGNGTRTPTINGNGGAIVNITGSSMAGLVLNTDDISDFDTHMIWAVGGTPVWDLTMPSFFNNKLTLVNSAVGSASVMTWDPNNNSTQTYFNVLDGGDGSFSLGGPDAPFTGGTSGYSLNPMPGTGFTYSGSAADFIFSGASSSVYFNGMPITSSGNLSITTPAGELDLSSGTNLALSSGGDMTFDTGGDAFISSGSGNIHLSGAGNVILESSSGGYVTLGGMNISQIYFGSANAVGIDNFQGNANDIFVSGGPGTGDGNYFKSAAALGLLTSVPWATPGTIGSTTPNTGDFTNLTTTGKITKYNNVNTAGYGTWAIRQQGQQAAQTTGQTLITFTPGATGSFIISGYLNVTAVTTDVIKMTITYKDENGTSQTLTPLSGINVVGNNSFTTGELRCNNTIITVASTLTTGIGSITYDQGATITQIG